MRTYQARFDVDRVLRTLRCLLDGERIVEERYAVLRFQDNIHLLHLLRRAGMPEQIAFGDARTHWTVTFQQLVALGYTEEQLKGLGILP